MDPENSTPSWCLVCRKRLTLSYTSGHGINISTILCLPERSPRVSYDHKREGHNGIYLHNPEPIDTFWELNMPLSLRLNESGFQGVDFNLPPIRDPKGLEKFDPVNGYAMREVLEPVPQVLSQNLNMTLNG
ncbi:uncharacterized protein EAF02_002485 [Botrytis sinoallii]|uniref:uncharacterized protein n=1 Tax=Botrytis sinoallii TaxID=1463999 RepID=UPI001900BCFD|nr:uncharacterized protein EAF02_002485 [Botrytis sinoallii]KAF7890070.1 hypothetical protein EAF02_002485 [Botrytis sinoallii]